MDRGKALSAVNWHIHLMQCYAILSRKKPTEFSRVCHFSHQRVFECMARKMTEKMLDFVEKQIAKVPLPSRVEDLESFFDMKPGEVVSKGPASYDEYGFHYITGIPGIGKSCSLRAVVVHLYGKFSAARTECNDPSAAEPSAAAEQSRKPSVVPDKLRRILMLEGLEFAANPEAELWTAMLQAYSDTQAALDDIVALPASRTALVHYLERRANSCGEGITIVVDDGNKLVRRSEGVSFLCSLSWSCKIVFCGSVSSEWLDVIRHPKSQNLLLLVDGLEGKELDVYLASLRASSKVIDTKETGTNPRLIDQYANDRNAFEISMATFREAIRKFLDTKLLVTEDLRRELTGRVEVPLLTHLLETRCFYRGEDRTLKCVSENLLRVTLLDLAERIDKRIDKEQTREISVWVQPIRGDDNTIRIGWNAEMAAILAMKFFSCKIYYETNKFVTLKTMNVKRFPGEMSRSELLNPPKGEGGVLHLPMKATHAGLNAYYEDDECIVAVQITVVRNPEYHHAKTIVKAEELFRGDNRIKVLLWIVYTDRWCSYTLGKADYFYVTMPFRSLSERLGAIDDSLKELRGRPRKDFCWSCFKSDGETSWIQCDVCDLYYHQMCGLTSTSPKATQNLRRSKIRASDENSVDSSLQATLFPFECAACSGKSSVKLSDLFKES